jgi:hypothetical protein
MAATEVLRFEAEMQIFELDRPGSGDRPFGTNVGDPARPHMRAGDDGASLKRIEKEKRRRKWIVRRRQLSPREFVEVPAESAGAVEQPVTRHPAEPGADRTVEVELVVPPSHRQRTASPSTSPRRLPHSTPSATSERRSATTGFLLSTTCASNLSPAGAGNRHN